MTAKPTRGGARKGAGRPALGHTEQLLVRVTPELREQVRAAAERAELAESDYVRGVLARAARSR